MENRRGDQNRFSVRRQEEKKHFVDSCSFAGINFQAKRE